MAVGIAGLSFHGQTVDISGLSFQLTVDNSRLS